MNISYSSFISEFLQKVNEYKFMKLTEENRNAVVKGYFTRSLNGFKHVCKYDFSKTDPETGDFLDNFDPRDIDEILDIVSEGMIMQWMKPYVYNQELLENVLNTRDFSTYSPAELLMRVGNAYEKVQKDYTQMIREYSYNHGDLSELHL